MTEIELMTDYAPDIFYQLKQDYFLPVKPDGVHAGRYATLPYQAVQSLSLPVNIYEVRSVAGFAGFLFQPTLPSVHYSTGLLIYSGVWRATNRTKDLTKDSFALVFKNPYMFIHNALNKCCLVSSPKLATSVENILTAV